MTFYYFDILTTQKSHFLENQYNKLQLVRISCFQYVWPGTGFITCMLLSFILSNELWRFLGEIVTDNFPVSDI